jgi:hypothetical protein
MHPPPPNARFVVTYFAVGKYKALSAASCRHCVREADQEKSVSEQTIWVSFQIGLASVVVVAGL